MIKNPLEVISSYQTEAPVNLDGIAQDLGLKVYKELLGQDIAGMIARDLEKGGSSGFAIYLNSREHSNRQRFTLAHEIAHFVLHFDLIESGITDDRMYRSQLTNSYETQANRFAASMLMPRTLVKKFVDERLSEEEMAKRFQVSNAAMKIRLEGLSK
jgi:Zn-dependent peptidase ImmA (M78 family)